MAGLSAVAVVELDALWWRCRVGLRCVRRIRAGTRRLSGSTTRGCFWLNGSCAAGEGHYHWARPRRTSTLRLPRWFAVSGCCS